MNTYDQRVTYSPNRKHCPYCEARETVVVVKSPQPDDRGGVEYAGHNRCTYCGWVSA